MKKLMIIGGGFAGSYIAKKLENIFEIVLVDTKDYFEFTPGILRTIIEPRHIRKIQVLHSDYLKKAKIVLGKVSEVNEKQVKVKNKIYNYDYLMICSGSSYNSPIKEQEGIITIRAKHLKEHYFKLRDSKRVLIIGGGLVGVELAAEICTKYKDKEITIVDFGNKLMNKNNLKSVKYAYNFLAKKGVKIILNERIVSSKKDLYITNKGRKIKVDIAFLCTGIKPNSEFMKKQFSNTLNDGGYIRVNEYLQLIDQNHIFVVGDVNDVKQEKTAQNAENQAKIAIKNILLSEKRKELIKYNPKKSGLVISLGKYKGVLEYRDFVLTGFIPAIMKILIEKSVMWRKS